MSERQPSETTNLDRYGDGPLPWDRPRDILAIGSQGPSMTFFLGTVGQDGTPHAAGVGAVWFDGDLYFNSGLTKRKARDLAARPTCTISVRLPGIDMVFQGQAAEVDDPGLVGQVAEVFRAGGWPVEVDGSLLVGPYSAPSAGPPPWHLFRFTFEEATGVATEEPHGATRWRFSNHGKGA
jgi:Pyridoxamine 5'-phosphate oxidase